MIASCFVSFLSLINGSVAYVERRNSGQMRFAGRILLLFLYTIGAAFKAFLLVTYYIVMVAVYNCGLGNFPNWTDAEVICMYYLHYGHVPVVIALHIFVSWFILPYPEEWSNLRRFLDCAFTFVCPPLHHAWHHKTRCV